MHESLQQFRFSSLAKKWGVHTKLIYKYQILYLDRITIFPWHHFVNDVDLSQPEITKKSIKPLFWHSRSLNSAPIESQCTTSY